MTITHQRDYWFNGAWHKIECSGICGVPFGCASQWHPEEIEKMQHALREKTSAERKGEPIHSGVMLYFPDALAAVARVSKAGNDKHNPGEPLHWARGKSMDQMDAAVRHMLTPSQVDPESGELEQAHAAWRALAELQLLEEKRLEARGIISYAKAQGTI